MPSHRAEGPGLIHRSCRAIILGRFPEPKTPGVRHARSAGMRAADTGRSVTPRDRAAARPPTPTAVRSVAGTTSVNASASGRPLRFRLIGRTGVSACATDVACSAKPGAGSPRNRKNAAACSHGRYLRPCADRLGAVSLPARSRIAAAAAPSHSMACSCPQRLPGSRNIARLCWAPRCAVAESPRFIASLARGALGRRDSLPAGGRPPEAGKCRPGRGLARGWVTENQLRRRADTTAVWP